MAKTPHFEKKTTIYVTQDGADFYFAEGRSRLFEYGDPDDSVTAPFKVPDMDLDMALYASAWFINWCRENNADPIWEEDHPRAYKTKESVTLLKVST